MGKIKKILISQKEPKNMAPYAALSEKYGVSVDFRPFYVVEPLTSREFRSQRVNILDYTAVVFSSRHAIDAFFALCEELRIKVPETMKYFCTTDIVAMYLQKHIVYRKRKIFFGDGTPASVLAQIGTRHAGEHFLITTSDISGNGLVRLFDEKGLDYKTAVLVKSVSQDLKDLDLASYDLVVFYNPADVKSLRENFPDFQPDGTRFGSYGKSIVKAMEEAGLETAFRGPSPEAPSAAKAIELYLEQNQ
jgi:uroporphyrinogen-III synthase